MTALWIVLAVGCGAAGGYVAAVYRTPALIARMTKTELADLARKVSQRRGG